MGDRRSGASAASSTSVQLQDTSGQHDARSHTHGSHTPRPSAYRQNRRATCARSPMPWRWPTPSQPIEHPPLQRPHATTQSSSARGTVSTPGWATLSVKKAKVPAQLGAAVTEAFEDRDASHSPSLPLRDLWLSKVNEACLQLLAGSYEHTKPRSHLTCSQASTAACSGQPPPFLSTASRPTSRSTTSNWTTGATSSTMRATVILRL